MSLHIPNWSPTELNLMRVGLGFVVVRTFSRTAMMRPRGKPQHPIGIARVVNLERLGSPSVAKFVRLGAYLSALFYAVQVLVPFALVYLSIATVLDITFRESHGSINHGDDLLAIVLTVQAFAVLVWNAAVQWHWHIGRFLGGTQDVTIAWWTVEAIVAVYFTSGLIKLINTRGRWIQRSPALLLEPFARADTDVAWGRRTGGRWSRSQSLTNWLLERPGIARCTFAIGLCVELLTPLGLIGKTALFVVGLALLALHRANARLLGLPFADYQLLVLAYLVNIPFVH